MKRWTVQCGYASYFANTVVVEAETLEAALEKAVETANAVPDQKPAPAKAGDADGWRSLDHCGPTFVQAAAEGADADPWSGGASALPIPDRFAEGGEPPVVTPTGHRPVGAVEITRGRVRLRFVEREGTVVAEGRARIRVLDEIVRD